MRPIKVTTSPLTNDVDGIAESQTLVSAGNLALDGVLVTDGIANAAESQIVTITSAGNDSGITFTATGEDADGKVISETVTGANAGAAKFVANFKNITKIAASGATASTVTAGWLSADGGVTRSLVTNWRQSPFNQSLFVKITGTLTLTVQHTESAPEDAYTTSFSTDGNWRSTAGLTAVTADSESNITFPIRALRVSIASGTGTVEFTAIQGQNG